MSFEAVPENSRRWSWRDFGWQTVPEAASCTLYAACIGQIIKQSNIHCNSSCADHMLSWMCVCICCSPAILSRPMKSYPPCFMKDADHPCTSIFSFCIQQTGSFVILFYTNKIKVIPIYWMIHRELYHRPVCLSSLHDFIPRSLCFFVNENKRFQFLPRCM